MWMILYHLPYKISITINEKCSFNNKSPCSVVSRCRCAFLLHFVIKMFRIKQSRGAFPIKNNSICSWGHPHMSRIYWPDQKLHFRGYGLLKRHCRIKKIPLRYIFIKSDNEQKILTCQSENEKNLQLNKELRVKLDAVTERLEQLINRKKASK